MNKQLYIILLLGISLFLISCGEKKVDEKELENSNSGTMLELGLEQLGVADGSGSVSEVNGSFPDFTQ